MNKAIILIAAFIAIVLMVVGFIAGALHHDYQFGTYLGVAGLCVVWLGSAIAARC